MTYAPREVLGNIFEYISEKNIENILIDEEIPDILLLHYPLNLNSGLCMNLKASNFDLLIKNPNINRYNLLRCAIIQGLDNYIKILLQELQIDPRDNDYEILRWVRFSRNKGTYKLFRKYFIGPNRIKGLYGDIYPFIFRLINNKIEKYIEKTKLIFTDKRIERSGYNDSLVFASENGNIEIVKLLLKQHETDPSAFDNLAIKFASQNNYNNIILILSKHGKIKHPKTPDLETLKIILDILAEHN